MFADSVYLDVSKLTKGTNYATGSYAALCSLESIATLLHGDYPPALPVVTENLIITPPPEYLPILEVGSGFGTLTRLLIKVFDNPIICYELDPSCINKLIVLKNSLSIIEQSRLTITNNLSQIIETEKYCKYFGIVIDGPILPKELYRSIRQSPDLRFVFVERYRLIQRVLVSYFLFRCSFQQQYLETRHNKKVTGAFFIVDVCADKIFSRKVRALGDFIITSLHLYPKFLKNLAQSKGRNIKVGTYKENSMGITQKIKK